MSTISLQLSGARSLASSPLPRKSGYDAVADGLGKRVRPLADRLLGDANGASRRSSTATPETQGNVFGHVTELTTKVGSTTTLEQKLARNFSDMDTDTYAGRLILALKLADKTYDEQRSIIRDFATRMGYKKNTWNVDKVLGGGSSSFNAQNNSRAAQILNIDSDWLATGEGSMDRKRGKTEPLAPDEAKLLEHFRNMAPAFQKTLLDSASTWAKSTLRELEIPAVGTETTQLVKKRRRARTEY